MKRLLCGLLAGVLLLSACQTKQEGPKTVIRGGGTKKKKKNKKSPEKKSKKGKKPNNKINKENHKTK